MTRFAVGEQVLIRHGRQHGLKATILQSQPAHVYKVKVEDGSVLFYSVKGLEKAQSGVEPVVSPGHNL